MKKCFNCGEKGTKFYGYFICDPCKSNLRLFTDKTIQKYNTKNPKKFSKEIQDRLVLLEKDYIKKKIKLLHTQEQLKLI